MEGEAHDSSRAMKTSPCLTHSKDLFFTLLLLPSLPSSFESLLFHSPSHLFVSVMIFCPAFSLFFFIVSTSCPILHFSFFFNGATLKKMDYRRRGLKGRGTIGDDEYVAVAVHVATPFPPNGNQTELFNLCSLFLKCLTIELKYSISNIHER